MKVVEQDYVWENSGQIKQLDNNNALPMVNKPNPYESSPRAGLLETKKNIIKTQKGTDYTLKTEYFLPLSWTKSGDWANVQSITIGGKYMYNLILKSKNSGETKGFIVKYDMKKLNKYHANKAGTSLSDLRALALNTQFKRSSTSNQKNLKTAITVGPVFTVGHGQSLAYNPKTPGYLWMWQDVSESETTLLLIKQSTLKPVKAYKFGSGVKPNTLTFDSAGNFYFYQIQSAGPINIYTGRVVNDNVKMKLLTIIKNRPGYYGQSISYNPANKRLYLISDGAFTSLPVEKLRNNQLTSKDLEYTVLKSKREVEGFAFDSKGHGYLLVTRAAEVLKTTKAYN